MMVHPLALVGGPLVMAKMMEHLGANRCNLCDCRFPLGDVRMKTTLNKIRANGPCANGWGKLLKNLGKTKADDEPLALTTILESNGLDDAIWCLRAVDGRERDIRLFAVKCARNVQHLMTDKRSLDALDVAERYANGMATQAELDAARAAAWDAARATQAKLFILMCEGAL